MPAEVDRSRTSSRDAVERAAAEVFVGRSRELGGLEAALGGAIDGRGRLCLIAGEPGIGKTRLAEALAAKATERGASVVWGRCWEGEGAPAFWPWVQVIRACMRECDAETLAARMGIGAPYVAQVVPEVREALPGVAPASPLDSEQARFRLYDACATFLRSVGAARPLVLFLDDLHWADKSSLLLLQFVAREVAEASLLIVGTYRDVEVSRGHPLGDVLPRLRRERTVDRMLLRGLGDGEVHAWLAALRGEDVPESFARTLSRETGGNPFFIKEILRHLLDEGIAHREGDRWEGRLEPGEIQLPESVREVIGRRLARLGEECAKLLTVASVIGQEFGLDVLERVSELGSERILEVLEEAAAVRVLEEAPDAIARYRFSHTLIRESLYGELRNLERVRLHRRIAGALEKLYLRDPEPHLSELAHHFLESLPGGDVAKAVEYAMRAGDHANGQLAYDEAANHYDRALQALELEAEPDERLRCELLLRRGEARWSAGEAPTGRFLEVAELAKRIGDPELFARAALCMAGPSVGVHFLAPAAWPLLGDALAALDERDGALRAQVMARRAAMSVLMGDSYGAAQLARAAIGMARRVGDERALAYVLDATPWATWGPDDPEDRLSLAEEQIRLATKIGDTRLAAEGHVWKACHFAEMGDIAAADREVGIQERFAESSRNAYHRSLAALNRGGRALVEARFEEAERQLEEAGRRPFFIDLGYYFVSPMRGYLSLLREQQGRAAELLPNFASAVERFPRVPVWRAGFAGYRISINQVEEARRDLEMLAAHDFSDIPRDMMWFNVMARLSEVVSSLGDSRRAALLYDLLLPYGNRCAPAGSMPFGRGAVSRSLGILATVLGRLDEAERHFEHALELNARIRARLWVAHTQHDFARMLVARGGPGDREKAAALSAEALATARDRGIKLLEPKLVELRAAAGFADEAPESDLVAPPKAALPPTFRREGDFWTIHYEDKDLRLKDAKGLQYVARLLREEGCDVHAMDLAAGGDGEARDGAIDRGDAGEILDPQARSEYRSRIEDLEAELEEATRWGDAGRAARAREEIDFLKEELSVAFGLGGRARTTGSAAERARKAVSSRLQDTIARIRKEHPVLALHLANSIRMGAFCCYAPERPVGWRL